MVLIIYFEIINVSRMQHKQSVCDLCDSAFNMASRWTKRRKLHHDVKSNLDMIRQLETTNFCLSDVTHDNQTATATCVNADNDGSSMMHCAIDVLSDSEDCASDTSSEYSNDVHSYKSSSDFDSSEDSEDIESDSESELYREIDDENEVVDFQTKLANWAAEQRIPHTAIGSLLHILHPTFDHLPKDPRTLLNTTTVVPIKNVAGGVYCHVGLDRQIVRLLSLVSCEQGGVLALQINVDGIPLYKSSSSQRWPIMGKIENLHEFSSVTYKNYKDPFIIGLYHGNSKPTSVEEFLSDFIVEMQHLESSGLIWNNTVYKVQISSFVCDMPARSYIKCVKGHGAYGGCDRCTQNGVYIRKVTFPETNAAPRTDAAFRDMIDNRYHTCVTPLTSLSINMVSSFVIDYMHLVCLGVVRKLVSLWLTGPLKTRIGWRAVKQINENFTLVKAYMPLEFQRKPRSISEFERWKAVEFRQLLLYTGPVCLVSVLPPELYNNFLLLLVAMSILLNPSLCNKYASYSQELLVSFVKHFASLYGNDMLTYNVHALIHICDDAKKYGVLDNISAFPFENFLGKLKRLVRKPTFPLQQIMRRMSERKDNRQEQLVYPLLKGEHSCGPIGCAVIAKKQYREVVLDNFTVKLTSGDRFVELTSGDVVAVQNIIVDKHDHIGILYQKYRSVESFFSYPCSSTDIGIYKFSHCGNSLHYSQISDVRKKYVVLPFKNTCAVGIPLAHTN